ncbi:mechanosensitive ion channel family protein [Winogradskyella litorisediminis]|uniref:Mechanosensitive ion channel family protein n=1 Tax=Winogradskyella litorisediminis TaxID=1156618 RepID=A0ABW3N7R3_9FLAO
MFFQDKDKELLNKNPEDLTIGEKIKRATMDETFTWEHVYDLLELKFIRWWDSMLLKLPNFLIGILVFFMFVLIAKYAGRLLYRMMKKSVKQESIRQIVLKLFRGVVWLIGFLVFLIILDLGVVLTSILGLAGVASLAVGLAVQGVLHNTFSGVILSFLPNLKIGDWVETEGTEGTISEISLRSVQIRRPDNNYVMIPNSQILENPFVNYSLTSRVLVKVNCGVAYDTDLKLARKVIIERLAEKFSQNEGEEIEFFYQEFGSSSINFMVRFWGNALNKKAELILINDAIIEIKDVLNQNGITIPFPMRTIEFKGDIPKISTERLSNKSEEDTSKDE